jgi:hypothetical protein
LEWTSGPFIKQDLGEHVLQKRRPLLVVVGPVRQLDSIVSIAADAQHKLALAVNTPALRLRKDRVYDFASI